MRRVLVILALAAASCGAGDPQDMKIAGINFADPSSMQGIAQRLSPSDRSAFGAYAMSRQMAGVTGLKETATEGGSPPVTVRDAIIAQRARDGLFKKRNELVAHQNALIGDNGLSETTRRQWEHLGNEVEAYDRRLENMTIK